MRTYTAMNNLQKNLIDDFSQKVRSFVRFAGAQTSMPIPKPPSLSSISFTP
jgi:hypothetical protein